METQNFDYFITPKDTGVLKNLAEMGAHLKELKEKMLQKEAEADMAKKEYEHYANSILPSAMHAAGVESLALTDGSMMSINRAYYCSPNKNDADQRVMAEWLKEVGGDFLLETTVTAGADSVEALESAGIPYAESSKVNTAKLKAFIKDKLGVTSGVATLSMEDIPKCVHFQEVTTVELKAAQ